MTPRDPRTPRRFGSVRGMLVAWLVCLPVAFLFTQLTRDVPVRSAMAAGAALDRYGERGTVTVTHDKVVRQKSGSTRHCFGEFRPRDGGPVVTGVRVRLNGRCTPGREVDVRFLPKHTNTWLIPTRQDTAYAGTGAGEAIAITLFMGLFCLLIGGPFVVCAAAFPALVATTLARRARSARAAPPP
ncbi:hypothetical protein ACPA54_30390 [Uniformispora flossi]|uniref:hypothetical protein n=1 Tax=Uniformispora flossi TaxID=3390723 RepID=UPI003C2AB35A